ncbi:hypothetical protein BYT27DRAFT_7215442 [Phlegmacium glaucopus]|nr:hypothetical protein BYT27DRAFT_7215442 [Phlegmacium glaucopus]
MHPSMLVKTSKTKEQWTTFLLGTVKAFNQTNMKNKEHQLEAIAHIYMAIDNDIQAHQIVSEDHLRGRGSTFELWWRITQKPHREYCDLDQWLRDFIAKYFLMKTWAMAFENIIQVMLLGDVN